VTQVEVLGAWMLDRVQSGAGCITRFITRPGLGTRAGHFLATDRGTLRVTHRVLDP